jgi:hypothetical protein
VLAAGYAAQAVKEKLPAPKAIMIVQPGQGPEGGLRVVPLDDCALLAPSIRLVVVVGDADSIVGEDCARRIWRETGHISERAFITVQSDDHGAPALRANHLSPVSWTRDATDALDWLAYWRTFDALMDSAFLAKKLAVDPDMGRWSDSTPVKPLKVER